jgi:AraC family transcriptional regulator
VPFTQLEFDPKTARTAKHEKMSYQSMRWKSMRADFVKRSGLERQETHIRCDRHILLMNLQGHARSGEDFVNGQRMPFEARMPGALTFIPADAEWSGWDEGDARAAYLIVLIGDDLANQVLSRADNLRLGLLRPRIGFRDRVLEQALTQVLTEMRRPDVVSEAIVESQARLIAAQLLRLDGWTQESAAGTLSPTLLNRIIEMIESDPGLRLDIQSLADEVQLSPAHFSRCFKRSMGMTPHAFIGRLRLQRAADLLKTSETTATQIAQDCGFSSSSHLSTAFREAYGLSPRDYRRRWKILLR